MFTAESGDAGKRLDAYLSEQIEGWSRSRLQRLIENGDVLVNEKAVKPSYKLREGDEIDVDLVEAPAAVFEPENIPLDIVYEDEFLAVINKPAGMVVHPGAGVNPGRWQMRWLIISNSKFQIQNSKFQKGKIIRDLKSGIWNLE